ncbi:hypothetical protein NDU88_001880 [Pleurodeles waltl]|uniref:BED-type domain-containing protein n=1 Tax=Pleurodeles waltl TaxID=8319 RepID=A0AAV7T0H6_PLEWA|nr:hypothetical protein NDU88_001880 [Pleurodeles waltl]
MAQGGQPAAAKPLLAKEEEMAKKEQEWELQKKLKESVVGQFFSIPKKSTQGKQVSCCSCIIVLLRGILQQYSLGTTGMRKHLRAMHTTSVAQAERRREIAVAQLDKGISGTPGDETHAAVQSTSGVDTQAVPYL